MRVSEEIRNLQDIVFKLLTEDARLRECDRKLSARVWSIQVGGYDSLKKNSAYDFLVLYTNPEGALFSQESIGRARRLIQEKNADLRGKNWQKRQDEQDDVKDAIK